ncbi:MAG: CPBP family intramembrane metalloprotease [Phycisphaerales bacterium]|nr:CPBP family intramembrane metalloprotease [Phycisphaerales bacterium]MCI0629727.1 CPBP family intramembrane metalloprotease [Phycisphaerales bacterium]MCI0676468.1 CPBP family intramembrane metalloprotease [Phycisphaerales bacterium]
MPRTRRSRPNRQLPAQLSEYLDVSKRPLQILAFLLPLILAYEISLVLLLRSDVGVTTVTAHRTLLRFLEAFGVAPVSGYYLGGIAIVVVLLVWHVLKRDPWRVSYPAIALMAVESLLLAFPLLLIGQIILRAAAVTPALAATGAGSATLGNLNLGSEWALSVGAGLYEELMFRMLLIAVIHTLLVDLGNASHNLGAAIAVTVSAAAFAWYHPLNSTAGAVFYFLAGLYFGAIYVVRGFGIVVATHALYDIITFTMWGSAQANSS